MKFIEFAEINPKVIIKRGQEIPFIPMDEIDPARRYVHAKQAKRFGGGGSKFHAGDTLFARITPCLENGKIAQFTGDKSELGFGSTEFIVFRAKPRIADPSYLFYLARTEIIRGPAEKSMSGASGRQRAEADVIKNIEVNVPPFSVQTRIASILSAYDDLIENNLRRIKILEEMAQLLYREWFVKFRFPGYEKVRMVDSPLGEIPEGWSIRRFTEAVMINPPIVVSRDNELPFVAMGGLSTNSMLVEISEHRRAKGGSRFQNGDTLFARITPCLENGKTGFVQFLQDRSSIGIGSTEFLVFRSKTLCPEFVYLLARSEDLRNTAIKSMTGASGRQRVQVACFQEYFFPHPPVGLLSIFSSMVSPVFLHIQALAKINMNLRQTRDLLIPKLISGELDVSDMDIKIKEDLG